MYYALSDLSNQYVAFASYYDRQEFIDQMGANGTTFRPISSRDLDFNTLSKHADFKEFLNRHLEEPYNYHTYVEYIASMFDTSKFTYDNHTSKE